MATFSIGNAGAANAALFAAAQLAAAGDARVAESLDAFRRRQTDDHDQNALVRADHELGWQQLSTAISNLQSTVSTNEAHATEPELAGDFWFHESGRKCFPFDVTEDRR